MAVDKQDGKASIPGWYRRWIESRYGSDLMAEVDEIGGWHDGEIGFLGYWVAGKLFVGRLLASVRIPFWLVALPMSVGVLLYILLPKCLKMVWWRVVKRWG